MLTDKQIEREEAFCDDWYMVRKMDRTPTYADAIAWADETTKKAMLDKVRPMLDNYIRQLQVEGRPHDAIMLITGKQEAAVRILELLQED